MKALEELDSFPHHSAGASDRGHAVVTGVFDETTIVSTVVALDRATLQRTKAGARHVLSHPSVAALAFDTRMLTIASRYVGDTPVPFRATLFDKSSSANWLVVWHQDTALPLRTRVDDPAWGPFTLSTPRTRLSAAASNWRPAEPDRKGLGSLRNQSLLHAPSAPVKGPSCCSRTKLESCATARPGRSSR